MANSSTSTNGFTVVTHVYPQQGAQVVTSNPSVSSELGRFLKVDVIALGVIQIMIGLVSIMLWIALVVHPLSVATLIGINLWGSLIYIAAGALTFSANKKLSTCLVTASLVMNIISTLSAVTGIIIHSLDFVFPGYLNDCYYYGDNWGTYYDCLSYRDMFLARSVAVDGVLLALSSLELVVSICVSVFASRAICPCYRDVSSKAPIALSGVTTANSPNISADNDTSLCPAVPKEDGEDGYSTNRLFEKTDNIPLSMKL